MIQENWILSYISELFSNYPLLVLGILEKQILP